MRADQIPGNPQLAQGRVISQSRAKRRETGIFPIADRPPRMEDEARRWAPRVIFHISWLVGRLSVKRVRGRRYVRFRAIAF